MSKSTQEQYQLRAGWIFLDDRSGRIVAKRSISDFGFNEIFGELKPSQVRDLLKSLESGSTVRQLASRLGISQSETQALLAALHRAGLVSKGSSPSRGAPLVGTANEVWEEFSSSRSLTSNTPNQASGPPLVRVIDLAPASGFESKLRQVARNLLAIGKHPTKGQTEMMATVVRANLRDIDRLMATNRQQSIANQPTVYVVDEGAKLLMTESLPGETPCLEDAFLFQEQNSLHGLPGSKLTFRDKGSIRKVYARDHPLSFQADYLAAVFAFYDIMHLWQTGEGLLTGRILEVNKTDLRLSLSRLIWNPKCTVCSLGAELPERIPGEPF